LEKSKNDWYILFPNHHEGLRLNKELKGLNLKCTIAPTPRAASTSCGISLMVYKEDLDLIRKVIEERGITIEKIVHVPARDGWQFRGC
jgi:hypothetical protein